MNTPMNNGSNLKKTAEKWNGLDRYGHVYHDTDWERGAVGEQAVFHRQCTKNMQTGKKLSQAKKRRDKIQEEASKKSDATESTSSVASDTQSIPEPVLESPPAKATRASTGIIFDKNLCIWCRKPDEFIAKKKEK